MENKWLTAERRQAIQMFATVVATMLVSAGAMNEADVQHILVIFAAVVQAIAGIISLLNLSFRGAVDWFLTAGRAAVYGAATVVAPAAAALGWINEEQSVSILTWVSLGLTAVAAFISIFYTKEVATNDDVQHVKKDVNELRDIAEAGVKDARLALSEVRKIN